MGSSSSVVEVTQDGSGTFGGTDPRKQFLMDIKLKCQQVGFPAWDQPHKYNIYQSAVSGDDCIIPEFGHSVVGIRTTDESIQKEYLIIDLRLDANDRIYTCARFKDLQWGQNNIISNATTHKITVVSVAMRQFAKLALDLIENHGRYSKFNNSCQTFSAAYLGKLQSYTDAIKKFSVYGTPTPEINQNGNAGSVAMGATTGATTGAVAVIIGVEIGGVVAAGAATCGVAAVVAVGAVGCAVGAVGANGVNAARNSVFSASKKLSSDNTYSRVQDPQRAMAETEWLQWELRIMSL